MWFCWLEVAAHNSLCTNHILQFGNEEQNKYLPLLASGEWIGAWGLTEPNTGSDSLQMRCTAEKDGDYYIINGIKTFITHAISGNVAVVLTRTGDLGDSRGISAFVVEKGHRDFLLVIKKINWECVHLKLLNLFLIIAGFTKVKCLDKKEKDLSRR
ncbi:MAG: acyl-CoA dehydrogenase family protein [Saprospiraceae bacterium]